MDQEVGQWDSFLVVWREIQADKPITSAELKKELESAEEMFKDLQATMPDDIARAISRGTRSTVALGSVLSKHVDQVYPAGLKLIREEHKHEKIKKWRVVDNEDYAGTGKKTKSTTLDDFAGVAGTPEHPSIIEKEVPTKMAYIERPKRLPALPAKGSSDSVSPISEYPQNADEEPGQSNADRIEAALELADERRIEWEEHFRTPDSKKAKCPICGDDISPGHSSRTFEGINYCISCPTHFTTILASVKALTEKNNGLGPTISESYEDVAGGGSRPPKKEHLPGMLRAVGAIETDGKWTLPST